MRVTLTSESFTEITVPKGTVQNLSPQASIEIVTTETKNSGLVLFPRQKLTFSNEITIYARSVWDTVADGETVILAVEPIFNASGGGGESYTLPIATATKLGGIKIGNNLTIDAETGVLDADAQAYVLPIASDEVLGGIKVGENLSIDSSTGVLSATASQYVLPNASASVLGGVKVGSNLSIDANGVLSGTVNQYVLPTASDSTLGGVKVGSNLSIDSNGVLSANVSPYVLPTATTSTLGGVIVGTNLSVDSNGVLSADAAPYTLPTASASVLGGVKVGTNLSIDANGILSADATPYTLPTATASVLGGVKIGNNVDVAADGTISIPVGTTSAKGVVQIGDNISVSSGTISVPKATASTLGVVSIGNGLSVDSNGEVTVDDVADATTSSKGIVQVGSNINVSSGTISVPVATSSTLGVVSVGSGLSVDANGEISADAVSDATKIAKGIVQIGDNIDVSSGVISVPKATSSSLGVVKPGTGLSVDVNGVLSATQYTLPIASASTLGGIKVGENLIINADTGVLSAVGGSSMLPHITVTAPTGCTVTVRQGSTVLTATEVSGTWDFELESFGYWTIKCEKPGDSTVYTEKRVLVSTVSDYLIGMDYAYRYGYKIKKSESNPSTRVEYTHMAVGMTPAHMNFTDGVFDYGSWGDAWFVRDNKPCMLKSDGTVDYYLAPNNYAFKADGVTASDVANTSYDGNAMSEIPLVWVYRYEDNEYLYETICNVQYDANYKAYAHTKADGTISNAFYFGMFGGSGNSTKIRSLSGQSLVRNLTRQQECDACAANGTGWYTGTWSQRCLIQTLLILMGKSTNTQAVFGNGNADNSAGRGESSMLTTGTLIDKGQFFGYSTTTSQVKVFHIEKFWGDQMDATAGILKASASSIYIKMTPENGGYKISDVTGYEGTGITPSGTNGGFLSSVNCGGYGLIPSAYNGSGTTYFCDGGEWGSSNIKYPTFGGYASKTSSFCGSFTINLQDTADFAHWSVGARPSYV